MNIILSDIETCSLFGDISSSDMILDSILCILVAAKDLIFFQSTVIKPKAEAACCNKCNKNFND